MLEHSIPSISFRGGKDFAASSNGFDAPWRIDCFGRKVYLCRAVRISDVKRFPANRRLRSPEYSLWRLRTLAMLLAFLTPAPAPAHPKPLRVPFRTSASMILIEVKIDGHPMIFLLDTGSIGTIVSLKSYRTVPFPLRTVRRDPRSPGVIGDSVPVKLDVGLGGHTWYSQNVSLMNLDGLVDVLGTHVDGILGQDILREFRYVRIDYSARVIELEE
jgi:Aspartyl protease